MSDICWALSGHLALLSSQGVLVRCGGLIIRKETDPWGVLSYDKYYEGNDYGPGMDKNDGGVQITLLREH